MEDNTPKMPTVPAGATPQAAPDTKAPTTPQVARNKYADKMNRPKKKLPKPVKVGLIVLVAAAVVAGGIFLVKMTREKTDTGSDAEQTGIATRGMLETYVEGSGRTAAKNKVDLGKDIKGEVTEVNAEVGQTVHAGDILFIVDPKETRKELDDANSELDDAMRAVDEANSGLNTAQKNLNNLTVTAPFTGKVIPRTDDKGVSVDYKVGQNLSEGTVLGTMVDDSTMRLSLYINYTYIDAVKPGASATVTIPASMSNVPGKVESVERVQKVSDDGAMLFRVTLSMKNPGTLKKDMVATASIATSAGAVMPAESGKLEYTREEDITVKSSGEIASIGSLDYYRYSAGDVLCRLKNEDTQTAVGTAQRSLEGAQKALQTKQERIAELEKLIQDSTVRSTIDGIVTNLSVTVGDKLEGNTTPCTVADLSSIVVNVDISELDIDKVQSGMPAIITMDMDESQMYTGTVSSVSMQATQNQNQQGGGGGSSAVTFPAVIQLDDTAGSLAPDRGVSFKIISASKDDCIMVPSTAVVYTEQGAAVYAKPAEGQTFENTLPAIEGSDVPEGFVLVAVETGIFDDTNTEIVSGIDEGTEVFLAGPQDAYANMGGMGGMSVAVG
ncbi:efflux RND transporter periplasmic adaptor subunit [Intestinibacillus massiliensis]|uniref:efflux RND transporter periplasmic adaptor subunit n=1 Tax=Intestinibacillus massiliensis TaxID=1871029 RepID=UPI000B3587EE|nr:HlyD family efflux transporter periplasmic adaptor subunit [Intestinibacillus massiliensis]